MSNKQKTALMKVIERLKTLQNNGYDDAGIRTALEITKSELPEERHNIIDANIDGQSRHDDASEKWAEQYFNENYL